MPATKGVVTRATVPFKGKMKKVIRDEARLLSLIAGSLAKSSVQFPDGQLACKGPGHCAMGALMYAAGISNKRITQFEQGSNKLGDYYRGPIARKMFDTYHLDATDASTIISSNDMVDNALMYGEDRYKANVQTRMERVIRTIDNLSKRERRRPSAKAEWAF